MRLSQAQIHAIEQVFQTVFSHGEVILFGSRVDDQRKGGDIDLFIQPEEPMSDLFAREIKKSGILLCRI